MGGLKILRPTEQSAESDFVNVYPNPVQPGIGEVLNILASTQVSLDIFTITGARVRTGLEFSAYQTHTFDPGILAQGLYIFRFNAGEKTFVERIVVR